jgi:hypothetical protein
MKDPVQWNQADLHRHLQHALDLELWTIPLYLTALYSIKGLTKMKHADYPDAAKLVFSVAIQEMLHAELVCNLSNALGYSPKFNFPEYGGLKGIPFIHPPHHLLPEELKGYVVKPQALNRESLQLFCAIEIPHPRKQLVWENETRYNSIAELYEAIKTGVAALWDTYYVGENMNTKQKNSFKEYHNSNGKKHGFSIQINSADEALKAIDAIIEQGEGADSKHVPADYCPPANVKGHEFDTGWYKGNLSHYQKFRMLLHAHHKLPATYEERKTEESSKANLNMQRSILSFWNEMETNFNSNGEELRDTFWPKMFELATSLAEVWETGMCPDFNFTNAGASLEAGGKAIAS